MGDVIQGPWKRTPTQPLDQELRKIAEAILQQNDVVNDAVIEPSRWPPARPALRSSPAGWGDPQR